MQTHSKIEIKEIVQIFLNKFSYKYNPGYTQAWREISLGKELGQNLLKNLSSHVTSKEEIFETYIMPNYKTINEIFYYHIENIITNEDFRNRFRKLIDFASGKLFLIIPIVGKSSRCELVGKQNVILIQTEIVSNLEILGISLSEQILFYLAHEMGHCLMHYHYQSSFKTKVKQPEDYKLFNEKMAWHVANDLLKEYCPDISFELFDKQKEFSLKEYKKGKSTSFYIFN